MIKKLLILNIIIITILFSTTLIKISEAKTNNTINYPKFIIKEKTNKIGYLQIDSIKIKEPIYEINSKENNIEEHVTILKESILPENDNSIVFIAAHSGTGNIAYFKNLDKLNINDLIILKINNKKYKYVVKEIWEENKNGYINVNKEKEKQVVLTTCSPNKHNLQLVINCIEKR